MKVNESLSILFMAERSAANKEGLLPIFVRITINGQRREISLGIRILPERWDMNKCRVIGSCKEINQMNNQIIQTQAKLEKHYLILTVEKTVKLTHSLRSKLTHQS